VLRDLAAEVAVALTAADLGLNDEPAAPERVTVVVCTRDRERLLEGCLDALARQDHPHHEVLVVDNASRTSATHELADRRGVRYVREDRPGLDVARNRGLREAATPIVAFTDDDARPDPSWLSVVARGFSSPDVHAVTGFVYPAELDTPAQRLFENVYGGMAKGVLPRIHTTRFRRQHYRPEWVGVGCNMAFRRDVLLALGGFDPALDVGTRTGGGGDLDAFQRVLEAGGYVVYRPDAIVRHLHRRELAALQRQIFDNGRAYGAMLTAAFLRASARERLAVAGRYARWLARWHGQRIAASLAGRERLPLRLVVAETAGAAIGPALYLRQRAEARSEDATAPAVEAPA
jgi:glycosyltransferase involved in cell wall biosynthesis